MIGGKVIASGGFGCVFDPPLKCKNKQTSAILNENKLSKLMLEKKAKDEYNEIQEIKELVKVIPNYSNYFLLDNFTLCNPDKLTKYDLSNFNKKCKPLKKRNINKSNINEKLNEVLIINMPNGGIDIDNFITDYFANKTNMRILNNSLIRLLVEGIMPMNNLGIYHCDIKESNVLVDILETDLLSRLIDWGLAIHKTDINKGIPRKLYRRPFQYNVPFSSVLFNKDFLELYTDFLKKNHNPHYYQIREFVINYIFLWNEIRGSGHLSLINDIISELTTNKLIIKTKKIKKHIIEYDFTYYYIVEYLSKILEKYTKNGEIDLMDYFQNVFIKNIDIWGFAMIYVKFYEYLNIVSKNIIRNIIIHILYENPLEPINTDILVKELTKLNNYLTIGGNKTIKNNRIKKRYSRKR